MELFDVAVGGGDLNEFNLELRLRRRQSQLTDRALRTAAPTSPQSIGCSCGELSGFYGCSGFLSQYGFVRHLANLFGGEPRQMPEGPTPDCVNLNTRWKAISV